MRRIEEEVEWLSEEEEDGGGGGEVMRGEGGRRRSGRHSTVIYLCADWDRWERRHKSGWAESWVGPTISTPDCRTRHFSEMGKILSNR